MYLFHLPNTNLILISFSIPFSPKPHLALLRPYSQNMLFLFLHNRGKIQDVSTIMIFSNPLLPTSCYKKNQNLFYA